jgi:hypothetical protein
LKPSSGKLRRMTVSETIIAQLVSDASSRMQDPQFISGKVNRLIQIQPIVMQYVVAHQKELTTEGIVSVLFHAALIHECVAKALGRQPTLVNFPDLDHAAQSVPTVEALAEQEPHLASYIVSNVDFASERARTLVAQKILSHLAAVFTMFTASSTAKK